MKIPDYFSIGVEFEMVLVKFVLRCLRWHIRVAKLL